MVIFALLCLSLLKWTPTGATVLLLFMTVNKFSVPGAEKPVTKHQQVSLFMSKK